MRIVRREGGTITPAGDPLTTAAYQRARQWREQWLALFEPARPEPSLFELARSELARSELARSEPATPAVIGPDGAVHAGPDALRCLAGIVGPDALSWRTALAPPPPGTFRPAGRRPPG
jgi:hypothetical protein